MAIMLDRPKKAPVLLPRSESPDRDAGYWLLESDRHKPVATPWLSRKSPLVLFYCDISHTAALNSSASETALADPNRVIFETPGAKSYPQPAAKLSNQVMILLFNVIPALAGIH